MSLRYRITREFRQDEGAAQTLTLEACKRYFADKSDFTYSTAYTVTGSVTMTIEGDFFMWSHGDKQVPFRHYQGDLYVAATHEDVVAKMAEIAEELDADVVEG